MNDRTGDREFWIQFRRALIIMLDAIEHRWALPVARPRDFPYEAPAQPRNGVTPQSEIPRPDAPSHATSHERDRY